MKLYSSAGALLLVVSTMLWAMAVPEASDSGDPIRIGLLTDVDSLPFLVAEAEGVFDDADVEVEVVVFRNPVERDAAFQAGQVDGIIADLLGAIFAASADDTSGPSSVITSITSGRYGLAGAPGSDFADPGDLAGVEIGISSNTVIEYVASSLLSANGVPDDEFAGLAVPQIPVRMELLLNGQLEAACLPEPLYSLVVTRGAVPLGDSTQLGADLGVMLFSSGLVRERERELVALYEAYWTAAQMVNADSDSFRGFLVETMGFPADVKDDFLFVTYERPRLPARDEVAWVAEWMADRELITALPTYETLCASTIVSALRE